MPLLLIPEYSGINKDQRIPDKWKTAHRKPPVKCFLTQGHFITKRKECTLNDIEDIPPKVSFLKARRVLAVNLSIHLVLTRILAKERVLMEEVYLLGFPGGLDGKESVFSAGDSNLILGLGRSLERAMANHSSILVWKTPWTQEPGGLQSMGSQRVRHN